MKYGDRNLPRREMLGGAVASAGLLGMAVPTAAFAQAGSHSVSTAGPVSDLSSLATLRSYQARRAGSWDRTGGNRGCAGVQAGETITLMDVKGPGQIGHIWLAVNPLPRFFPLSEANCASRILG